MTEEQAEKVLEELNSVRPEMLNGEAKRLFEAIMKIADERDEACKDIKKKDKQIEKYQNMLVTNDMLHVIECENKDKIIDLMAEFLNKRSWREHQLKNDTCYCCKIEYGADDCKDCIKQYFENKAKELINK